MVGFDVLIQIIVFKCFPCFGQDILQATGALLHGLGWLCWTQGRLLRHLGSMHVVLLQGL